MVSTALDFTGACAVLAMLLWALALVVRADRRFHSRRPVTIQAPPRRAPLELLRAHARNANVCDACRAAPWEHRTRNDEYLCRVSAPRFAELSFWGE